jgi:hypothetical protein
LPRNAAGLSAAQCGGLVVEMRIQFAEVPGGKPIIVVSETTAAPRFTREQEQEFLAGTGLGGVLITREEVFIGPPWERPETHVVFTSPYVYRPVGFPDNSATEACDGTCTYGAGCACEDGKHNA